MENIDTMYFSQKVMDAQSPKLGDVGAAGHDLYAVNDCELKPWSRSLISTGIALEIPTGFYGQIAPRSGLATKGIDIGAGVIDSSYRGEIKVLLINSSDKQFDIKKGDRIAQIIFLKCFQVSKFVLKSELSDTQRGTGGFGSTGLR